jgi:signal transduction histidine kinase/ligand-binding sensor domain-containing protein
MKLQIKWLFAITFIVVQSSWVAAQSYYFKHYNRANGLCSDFVFQLFQDSNGNIWIATDKGACRYNGTSFQHISTSEGLPNSMIYTIAEDPQKRLWFGMYQEGVCCYDGKKIIKCYKKKNEKKYNINSIAFDKFNRTYLKTNEGIDVIEGDSIRRLFDFASLGYHNILSTTDGRIFMILTGSQILQITPTSTKIEVKIIPICKQKNLFNTTGIYIKESSSPNQFWLGGNGYFQAILLNDTLQIVKEYPFLKATIGFNLVDGFPASGSRHDGCNIFGNKITTKNGLVSDFITDVLQDREENIWVATFGKGIQRITNRYAHKFALNTEPQVITVCDEHIFLGQEHTVSIYDRNTFRLKKTLSKPYLNVRSFLPDGKKIHVGAFSGYYQINGGISNKQLDCIKPIYSGISGIVKDKNNNLLLSSYGEGILAIDSNGAETLLQQHLKLPTTLIENLYEDGTYLWAFTLSYGAVRIKDLKDVFIFNEKNGLSDNSIYAIYTQKKPSITWIATETAISCIKENEVIKTIPYPKELLGKHIIYFFEDAQKRFFAVTENALLLWNGQYFQVLNSFPLLENNNNTLQRPFFDTLTQQLFLTDGQNAIKFDITNARLNQVMPFLEVEKLQIDTLSLLTAHAPKEFNYQQNRLYAQVSVVSFLNEQKNKIRYKLDGIDFKWHTTQQNEILYQGLPPGRYQLWLQAVNADGSNSLPTMVAAFTIRPPFWKTIWFIILVIVLTTFISALAVSKIMQERYKKQLAKLEAQRKLQHERERISRELHDSVGADITYIIRSIEAITIQQQESKAITQRLEKLSEYARKAMQELRETIWSIHQNTFYVEEFIAKLKDYSAQIFEYNNQIQHQFIVSLSDTKSYKLSPAQTLHLFRILQEALQNTIKHAQATAVVIRITTTENKLEISIEDNGKGFEIKEETTKEHYGLQNMQQRATEIQAMLEIVSKIGKGTKISLQLFLR